MPPRPIPTAVGLLVLGLGLVTIRGAFGGGPDEEVVFVQAESLLDDRDLRFDREELARIDRVTGVWEDAVREGPPGTWTAVYGPGQALAAAPLVLLGRAFSGDRRDIVRTVCAFGPIVLALTCALLAAWLLQLGYRPRLAAAVSLGYATCTCAWPYAKSFLSEPLSALCLLAAAYAAWHANPHLAGRDGGRPPRASAGAGRAMVLPAIWSASAGLAAAAMLLVRPYNLVLLPPLILLAWPGRPRALRLLLLLAPPAAAGGWWLWYNQARFGAPLDFGYLPEIAGDFSLGAVPRGIAGQLVSPGRGLLFFAPPVILAPLGWPALRRCHRAVAAALLAAFGLQLALYSLRSTWWANWCWGPRYLVPVLPLLALPLAAALDARPRRARLAVPLALLGLAGALAGLLVYNGLYQDLLFREPDGLRRLLWVPADSPLIAHWRLAFAEGGKYLDLLVLQLARQAGFGAALGFAAPRLVPLLFGLILLARPQPAVPHVRR